MHIFGAGTRNTVFLPGEVLEPFIFNMEGVQRPTSWEWGLFESSKTDRGDRLVHPLRFIYENEPPAFISPPMIVRFEDLRRSYKWKPLSLVDVFHENIDAGKFVFKAFPKSKSRSSQPLY